MSQQGKAGQISAHMSVSSYSPNSYRWATQTTLTSLLGHIEGREENWMGEWRISTTFSFEGDQMAEGKEIGFIKIALIYLGKISKRNMRLAP